MANKISGFVSRLVVGSEKSEDYARASLPSSRWSLFWDILKGRFGKLVIVNILVLLFFIPLFLLIVFKNMTISGYGTVAPFGQGFGMGYQAVESLNGFAEQMTLSINIPALALLPIAALVAAIGLAGGAYVIRNMVWTEGIFVANDFWKGIKQNIGKLLLICFIYSLVYYAITISVAFANHMIAVGSGVTWLLIMSKVIAYIVLILYSIMTLHMITMVVTYKVTIRKMFKNAFLFTLCLLPQNVFFFVLTLLPFVLMFLGGIFSTIGLCVLVLIGFSWALLVWTDYSQWVYDSVLDPKNRGMQKNKGIYEKVGKEGDAESLRKYREQLAVRSSLNSRPIKPITDEEITIAELPQSFNRSDIEKLRQSKQALYDDHARYVEEHMNDPEFAKTEEEIQREQKTAERDKRIEKAKRELAKRDMAKNKSKKKKK